MLLRRGVVNTRALCYVQRDPCDPHHDPRARTHTRLWDNDKNKQTFGEQKEYTQV